MPLELLNSHVDIFRSDKQINLGVPAKRLYIFTWSFALAAIYLAVLATFAPSDVRAQVNTINSVVFGSKIPRFMADPNYGMPVRNTAADYLSAVPNLAGARAITFSPCSDSFITVAGSTASLWQSANGSQSMALQHGGPIRFVAFGNDGSIVVTGGGNWTRIWSAPKGEFKHQFDHKVCATERMSHLWDARQFVRVADVQFGGGYR